MKAKKDTHMYWSTQEIYERGMLSLSGEERQPAPELLAYLNDFQYDQLSTGAITRHAGFTSQRAKLVEVMQKKYPEQGYRQVISGLDVDVPNLFELLLVMHYLTHEIELADNHGYEPFQIAAGIKTARSIPYAELTITGADLQREVAPLSVSPVSNASARVFMQGRAVCVEYSGAIYKIALLQEDGTYYRFMNFLLSPDNFDIDLTLDDINSAPGLAAIKTLTEPVRHCGFDKALKDAFFPKIKKDRLRFEQTAVLNAAQVSALKKRAEKIASKS